MHPLTEKHVVAVDLEALNRKSSFSYGWSIALQKCTGSGCPDSAFSFVNNVSALCLEFFYIILTNPSLLYI